MRTNTPVFRPPILTHEGAPAPRITPEKMLRRSVMSCMLFEDTFYEDGQSVADRIASLVKEVRPETVAQIAVDARSKMKLRHVPLWIVRQMARLDTHKGLVASTLAEVIQRPDEIAEFVALYWKEKRQPLSAQVKKGLARAFTKFNAFALAKYNRDGAVKLRDVLFLCSPKPKDEEQAAAWKKLVDGTLESPDTWEVALSGGGEKKSAEDKKAHWERLLSENKLGALALLRNMRNMREAAVDEALVRKALLEMKTERVLPFRFIAAARYAPQFEPEIESAMFRCVAAFERLPGKTAIVIDNSGSMYGTKISAKSEMDRADAACALAILVREVCERCSVISFSTRPVLVPSRRGFALRDAIQSATEHGGTNTQDALILAAKEGYDRIIVITDEQSHQAVSGPGLGARGYFINVASYQNGIGYKAWTHIDGFSESVLDFIAEFEKEAEQ